MIPNTTHRHLATSVEGESTTFGISAKDTTHLITVLRDQIYTDKVLAVLREYAANAWDAHQAAGIPTTPIRVSLPTLLEPTLTIQDFGPGLSLSDVRTVYTQYGASTKRTTNTEVGALGIGSKAAFAYTDSFTIISCHGGERHTYVAVLDESERGIVKLLCTEPWDDSTGVTIQVAVDPKDVREFHEKAVSLFKHFTPPPDINIDLPAPHGHATSLSAGRISGSSTAYNGWIAVMGCIPYRIDLHKLRAGGEQSLPAYFYQLAGEVHVAIGEVHVSASREELKYTEVTRRVILRKLDELVEEYVLTVLEELERADLSPWQRLVRAAELRRTSLPCPEVLDYRFPAVVLIDQCGLKTFQLRASDNRTPIDRVRPSDHNTLLLRDDSRTLKGFSSLSWREILVVPTGTAPTEWAAVHAELAAFLDAVGLTGIPIEKLSDRQWVNPRPARPSSAVNREKHKITTFRLKGGEFLSNPRSGNWDIERREPTDDDVFVILHNFRVQGYNFFEAYQKDRKLLECFGLSMPPVYGYKSTASRPLQTTDCRGTEYAAWRTSLATTLRTPAVEVLLQRLGWERMRDGHVPTYLTRRMHLRLHHLVARLGRMHPLIRLLLEHVRGARVMQALRRDNPVLGMGVALLAQLEGYEMLEAKLARRNAFARYPMITLCGAGLFDLWGPNANTWIDYIQLVDRDRGDLT